MKEIFNALTKDDVLQPYKSDHDFRSTKVGDAGEENGNVGQNLYFFDKRYQTNITVAELIKVKLNLMKLFLKKSMVMLWYQQLNLLV